MGSIVHFDIAAVIMLLVIFLVCLTRREHKGTTNRMFQLLVVNTLFGAVFNVVAEGLENSGSTNDTLLYVMRMMYQLLHNFSTPVYIMYVVSLTRTWHKFKGNPLLSVVSIVPYALVAIVILTNPFTHWLFTYNEGILTRNKGIVILYINAAFYLGLGFYYIIKYAKLLKRKKVIILCSAVPLMLAAVVLKLFFPNSLVEIFSNAVSLMIISMTIQNPDKDIDTVTGLKKFSTYGDEIKMDYINDKHQKMIFVNLVNFESLRRLLGYEGCNACLKQIADYLIEHDRRFKAYSDIYYLDQGRFRIIVNEFNIKKAEPLALALNESSKLPVRLGDIDINVESVVAIAELPNDIGDFKSLNVFGSDFHHRVPKTGELVYAAELFKQRDFQLMNDMEMIIERAFENKSFQIYYQPIYSVEKQRFVSAEALLRLIDPDYGFVPPNLFIPYAEKSGAINRIGDIVLEEVCRFISTDEFNSLGLDYIEINLSVAQCMQRNLADNVLSVINKYGIAPEKINLEITETAANYNQAIMIENMTKLINAGISFSLDDFGTGYSNMARVASLPLKIVKLDKTFVDNSNKPRLHVFLKGTIKMLKDMEMEIVVEGIETEQMVMTFSELNCDYIQGYFYSKPIPQNEFVSFIRNTLQSA